MTKLIVLAARKQSGKTTLARFITQNANVFWPKGGEATNDARIYNFAGPIKEFCHKVMGLTYEQCYGTDAQKNTETQYRWEDMPHYPRILEKLRQEGEAIRSKASWFERTFGSITENYLAMKTPAGLMTARQILQEVGTGIGRQLDHSLWTTATFSAIRRDAPDVAVIDDCRFPEEADGGWKEGGVVIRLERAPLRGQDQHASETSLDKYDKYLGRIPDSGVIESCRALMRLLRANSIIERVPADAELVWPEGHEPQMDPVFYLPQLQSKYGIDLIRNRSRHADQVLVDMGR